MIMETSVPRHVLGRLKTKESLRPVLPGHSLQASRLETQEDLSQEKPRSQFEGPPGRSPLLTEGISPPL